MTVWLLQSNASNSSIQENMLRNGDIDLYKFDQNNRFCLTFTLIKKC